MGEGGGGGRGVKKIKVGKRMKKNFFPASINPPSVISYHQISNDRVRGKSLLSCERVYTLREFCGVGDIGLRLIWDKKSKE